MTTDPASWEQIIDVLLANDRLDDALTISGMLWMECFLRCADQGER